MPAHERFEELCAVAAIGQLSDAEFEELSEHLKSCYACRRTAGDFASLLNLLPVEETDTDESDTAELLSKSYRRRFLERARTEGVQFSREVDQRETAISFPWWPRLKRIALISVPALAAVIAVAVLLPSQSTERVAPVRLQVAIPVPNVYSQAAAPAERIESVRETNLASENENLRVQLARAKADVSIAKSDAQKANARAAQSDQQLHNTRLELARSMFDADTARTSRDEANAELLAQQYRLSALSEELKKQKESVEQDKQLSNAARDVREMMGARNLHIIDVFDADGKGRSRKSFGRVFYVEGKSLIFYAFDLKQKSNGSTKVSFQAWGQRGSSDRPKSLGVFYVDDHAQSRWVLKVEDAAKLAFVESVFVTVEPVGGADRPTGQKLLYAFLGSQANHP